MTGVFFFWAITRRFATPPFHPGVLRYDGVDGLTVISACEAFA